MEIITLGTGSPIPDAERAGPSTLVRTGSLSVLVDCGRGVLMRTAAVPVGPTGLAAVLLTHLHSDHITDLNDVITMQWAMSFAPAPLLVVGPVGTAAVVERTLAMLEFDVGYRLDHHDDLTWRPDVQVTEIDVSRDDPPVVAFERDGLRVLAAATDHRPVHPTLGYRFEADRRVAVLAGDTKPCAGLDALSAGADLYVQTVVRRLAVEAIPLPRLLDILDYHSDLAEAGATAARAGARHLVLTHPVPAPPVGSPLEAEWEAEAAVGFAGKVTLAHDLQSFAL